MKHREGHRLGLDSWPEVRTNVFIRDNHICQICGKRINSLPVADHITPIALGGDEWDMNNIQTLCIDCDKIKTRQDQARITEERRVKRKLSAEERIKKNKC